MPACDARYDVTLWDGRCAGFRAGLPAGSTEVAWAVVDFTEDREPDDWGDPGRLLAARLAGYRPPRPGQVIGYGPVGVRNRPVLWLDGRPSRTLARHRRYLRWSLPPDEVPPDDDPAWVVPP